MDKYAILNDEEKELTIDIKRYTRRLEKCRKQDWRNRVQEKHEGMRYDENKNLIQDHHEVYVSLMKELSNALTDI